MMKISYHNWPDACLLSNRQAEVVVVPAIGRIMQFRRAGTPDGVFWENRALDGQQPDPASAEWMNFGGDKSWPAPQGDWPINTPRAWPPPTAFDSMPAEAVASPNGGLMLTSPVDPHYGIRVARHISLAPGKPRMTVRTVFNKVEGNPITVSVWVVTQFQHPARLFVPLPEASSMTRGFVALCGLPAPPSLCDERGLLGMTRDPLTPCKIGTEAQSLLWLGQSLACRIDTVRQKAGIYPDYGSSVEVYTNPDPLPYIELETLSPMRTLHPGDQLEQTNIYTLLPRQEKDSLSEARRILRLPC